MSWDVEADDVAVIVDPVVVVANATGFCHRQTIRHEHLAGDDKKWLQINTLRDDSFWSGVFWRFGGFWRFSGGFLAVLRLE